MNLRLIVPHHVIRLGRGRGQVIDELNYGAYAWHVKPLLLARNGYTHWTSYILQKFQVYLEKRNDEPEAIQICE
jgi:hypothetical protein